MAAEIPFARLGIPKEYRDALAPDSPRPARLAAARGLVPVGPDLQLSMLYVLTGDPDVEVAELARQTLVTLPLDHLLRAIHLRTHPKVLEYLADARAEPELDDRLAMHKLANDRTVRLVARRAGPSLCEKLCGNHERLLMTPQVWLDLRTNAHAAERDLQKAEGFLRMEGVLPEVPQAGPSPAAPVAAAPAEMDLEAEILAALAGQQSPAMLAAQDGRLEMVDLEHTTVDLGGFQFDFADDTQELSWLLTADRDERASAEELRSMEGIIRDMSPGQKIKLAYLGNQESRGILIRDSNKLVAAAVVKSGRMSDGEGLAAAANRNLADDVIREVATNREWVRKYPFMVALVNNPKCPASVAMGFIRNLNRRDLQALTRNRNISSAVSQAATRLFREKFKDA